MSKIVNAAVHLDKKKCTDKAYFDRAWRTFSREVLRQGVLEDLRFKRCYYKPSVLKKLKKQIKHKKWKYYN
jgi:ribosomal protein S21